ncbi:GIY-YIG nuclease family protein [Halorubrum sp. DTA46]|uniref:GIY-YIG nuclease family protein n=1 Tax=Halorubrum sp. DTA46 TaxID=3402162 RepID=UPI003AAD87BB
MTGASNDREPRQSDASGTYTLLLDVPSPIRVEIGALGSHDLPDGAYAYTGSALGSGGFSRVNRHRRVARGDHDVRHWHIDYVLGHPQTDLDRVVRSVSVDVECAVADRLPAGPVDGFGSSDCDCRCHLAAGESIDRLTERVRAAHESAGDDSHAVDVVAGSDRRS